MMGRRWMIFLLRKAKPWPHARFLIDFIFNWPSIKIKAMSPRVATVAFPGQALVVIYQESPNPTSWQTDKKPFEISQLNKIFTSQKAQNFVIQHPKSKVDYCFTQSYNILPTTLEGNAHGSVKKVALQLYVVERHLTWMLGNRTWVLWEIRRCFEARSYHPSPYPSVLRTTGQRSSF